MTNEHFFIEEDVNERSGKVIYNFYSPNALTEWENDWLKEWNKAGKIIFVLIWQRQYALGSIDEVKKYVEKEGPDTVPTKKYLKDFFVPVGTGSVFDPHISCLLIDGKKFIYYDSNSVYGLEETWLQERVFSKIKQLIATEQFNKPWFGGKGTYHKYCAREYVTILYMTVPIYIIF